MGWLAKLFGKRDEPAQSKRHSLEDPSVPLTGENLARHVSSYIGGISQPHIHPDLALRLSVVQTCVRILAESIATLPLVVYERMPDNSRVRAWMHPVHDLLAVQPNPLMTAATWKETMGYALLLWGNAYSVIERNNSGVPVALWPVHPSRVHVFHHEGDNRRVIYRVDLANSGDSIVLGSEEMLHIPGLAPDGVFGYSPIALARANVGLSMQAQTFTEKVYENGAWVGGTLEVPEALSDKAYANMESSLKKRRTGVVNAFHPMILEEGTKWNQAALPAQDALFIEQRKYEKREILSIYRVPPHMAADLEGGASFASIEQMSLEFVRFTLGIYLAKWRMECTAKLLTTGPYFADFITEAFLQGDTMTRFAAYEVARRTGWLSVNEIRRAENLAPVDGGDTYLQPMNMEPLGASGDTGDTGGDVAARALLMNECGRVCRVEVDRTIRAIKTSETDEALALMRQEMAERMTAALLVPASMLGVDEMNVRAAVEEHISTGTQELMLAADPVAYARSWHGSRVDSLATALKEKV